jgi:hypothetical protein
VNDAQSWMCLCKLIKDLPRFVLRTVINGDDFQVRIVDFHKRRKCGGQFFFFVARCEEDRDSWTLPIRGRREISDPWKVDGSVGNPETVGEPKQRDQPKQ